MLLIALIPLLIMPVSQQSMTERIESMRQNDVYNIDRQQYDDLYRYCGVNKCCRSSVRQMRKAMGVPTTLSKGCLHGVKASAARCPGSLLWCEYQNATGRPTAQ